MGGARRPEEVAKASSTDELHCTAGGLARERRPPPAGPPQPRSATFGFRVIHGALALALRSTRSHWRKPRIGAARERLFLVTSKKIPSGYKGVHLFHGRYIAQGWEGGTTRHIGSYATAVEAALEYTRWLGPDTV